MFLNLIAATEFMPHGSCYLWQSNLVGLHALSDLITAIAYYSIPVTLAYFAWRREDLPFPRIFWLFAAFIIFCGTTHGLEIWTLWHPDYWLAGVVKALTALISLYTAIEIIPLVPQALALPNPAELKAMNQRLETEIAKNQETTEALRESEKRFRTAFECAPIGKALVARSGKWLEVNRSLCEIMGYSEKELLALTFQEITYAEDKNADLEYIEQMLAGKIGTYQIEKRYVHKLGHLIWVALSFSLVRKQNGEPQYFIAQIQDISIRKKTEAELRQSEKRYRLVVEDQTELIVRFIRNGRVVFVNQAYCQYFRVSKEDSLDRADTTPIFPEDKPRVEKLLQTLNRENSVATIEYRVLIDEGIRWMQWVYRAIFYDDSDKFSELQCVGRDISELIAVRESLRESEELFRMILKNSPITVYTQDTELRYTWMYNPFVGYQFEELVGKLETEVFSAEDARRLATIKKKVLNSGVGTREEVALTFNEEIKHYDLTVEPLRNNERVIEGITCIALDISERKEAERDVRHKESIIRSFYSNKASIAMGVCELVGDDLIHVTANQASASFFGLEVQNLPGSSFRKTMNYPEIVDKWIDGCHRSQFKNKPIYFEYIHAAESDSKYISVNISPINYCDRFEKCISSECLRFSYVAEDITEHKLAAIFKQKQIRIKEIHHRVKNNLQIICSLLNLQARAIGDRLIVEHLHEIRNRVKSISLIHEKLYQSENITQINLSEYITDLTNSLFRSYLLTGKNIDLSIEITQNFWLDLDTAVPCGLIINELISNALKYAFEDTTRGKVKVRVEVDPTNHPVLIIADNGKGLPKNFDIENTKTLGLKLVNNLIDQLRGKLEIDNYRGTQYKITLTNFSNSLVFQQGSKA